MTPDRRIIVREEDLDLPADAGTSAEAAAAAQHAAGTAHSAAAAHGAAAAHAAGAARTGGALGRLAGVAWVPAGITAVVATVVVAVGVVVVVKPGAGATAGDFCKALRHGEADIRSHIPNTRPQGTRQSLIALAQAFGNIGRYESMLDDLVDNSPKEIHTDMKTARDTFKESIDAAPGGISDPLGTLASVLFKNVIHQPSFQNVDAYAQRHCGSTVFGTRAG